MRLLRETDVNNKKVLLRVDFNVPVVNGEVSESDSWRIVSSIPTFEYLLERNAKIIIMTHLGRPDGKPVEELKTAPLASILSKILSKPVKSLDDCIGSDVSQETASMNGGDMIMLENLRFHPEEEKGGADFAQKLASLGDVYVDNAFGAVHRAHASISIITQFLPSCAGLLLEKEVNAVSAILNSPKHPMGVIMGGVKIETKAPTIKNMLKLADKVFLGGGLANTLMKARGMEAGKITYDEKAGDLDFNIFDPKIILPDDAIVSNEDGSQNQIKDIANVGKNDIILDIGPKTVSGFSNLFGQCDTIIWNGNMGKSEVEAFAGGTLGIAKAIADTDAFSLIGGGDTTAFVYKAGLLDKFSHVSTGGGSLLEMLAGYSLPGIEALNN